MRQDQDGDGDGDEGDAIAHNLHDPGGVHDEDLPLHVGRCAVEEAPDHVNNVPQENLSNVSLKK